jgi:hypothetical protein
MNCTKGVSYESHTCDFKDEPRPSFILSSTLVTPFLFIVFVLGLTIDWGIKLTTKHILNIAMTARVTTTLTPDWHMPPLYTKRV